MARLASFAAVTLFRILLGCLVENILTDLRIVCTLLNDIYALFGRTGNFMVLFGGRSCLSKHLTAALL